jgi:hypothetical protein
MCKNLNIKDYIVIKVKPQQYYSKQSQLPFNDLKPHITTF